MGSTGAFPRHRLLDVFDLAGDSQAAESFVRAFDALVDFIERADLSTRRFGVFRLAGLPELAHQYGRDSDVYSAMTLAVKAALSNVCFSCEYPLGSFILTDLGPAFIESLQCRRSVLH